MSERLTEEDIKTLFGKEENPAANNGTAQTVPAGLVVEKEYQKNLIAHSGSSALRNILSALSILVVFVLLFVVSFIILNFPSLWAEFKYSTGQKPVVTAPAPPPVQTTYNDVLIIPKIGVNTPISWNIPADATLPALEHGVAHYLNTALPGQTGNIFITGHSSYYWWNGGSYKQIFALLDKLEVGDKIYINYQGAQFTYQVIGKRVVSPNNLDVLSQTPDNTLSLMTCVPVGTNINRLIVVARQVNQ